MATSLLTVVTAVFNTVLSTERTVKVYVLKDLGMLFRTDRTGDMLQLIEA